MPMWTARSAVILGALFIVVGAIYYLANSRPDPAGAVLLVIAGLSIGFGFGVLIVGSRDL
jgi:hypothetical protein